ncbi:5'-AMP-activated protein kinase, gamma-1 subunit [Spironucleus salmonicida]|uniref:5'-AMP-activated protein kinase, gamma-1 subunit n=1 Tax=Spironucleus salmonicida TaxID=348837 RepID=V6LYK5_9EUKA|nr:5'-AMP-activated protein kinase, gamma-1 subunit [Spironucleus salmonicida]|eukprot:EST48801.1 5'-AMP-activated protein kinase, gamma-1 subunit [Spironucleus salmonicida]
MSSTVTNPTVLDFFKQFTAYHIMPTSARTLAIDSDTTLYKAFRIMNDNLVSSSFVWDRSSELYTGVLTSTDIMKACITFYHAFQSSESKNDITKFGLGDNPSLAEILSHVSISSVKTKQQLCYAQTTTTLLASINQMMENNVHRLPIIDNDGSIIATLTYRSICRFLVSKFRFESNILSKPIIETRAVSRLIITIPSSYTVLEATQVLVKHSLSVVPVLNENNEILDVFSKYDFSNMATTALNMQTKITEIIASRPPQMEGLVTASTSSTVGSILRMIADKNLHRVILVDDEQPGIPVAVVSLRHVLKFLCVTDVYAETETRSRAGSLEHEIQLEDDSNEHWHVFSGQQ